MPDAHNATDMDIAGSLPIADAVNRQRSESAASPSRGGRPKEAPVKEAAALPTEHESLKYHLLGPSLTKAGQEKVDQQKISEIIYDASKGSKFFNNEEVKDKVLTEKIARILARRAQLEKLDLSSDLRRADECMTELELSRDLSQTIVHIDCDAFYAAVEELDRPELKNVPFAVGKGVLTTCNYEARKYGCRSAMAGFVAKKLCPQLVQLPLNFAKYTAKATEVRAILAEYDPRFESASIDEAYLNITQYCQENGLAAEDAVSRLRNEVAEKTKITISAGIAANAKIAKIASNKNKPNGQCFVPSDRNSVMSFMRDLPTRKVNGIGRVFERELRAIGVETCGDIYAHRAYLQRLFGEKAFHFLIQTYLGLGRTNIQPAEDYERKSVGTESTFHDKSGNELFDQLKWTSEELEKDLIRTQFKGRTLVLKIKLHTYEVFTRQVATPKAVNAADDLYKYAAPMLAKLNKEIPRMKLRLMGLRCTHLVSTKKGGIDFFGLRRPAGGSPPRRSVSSRKDAVAENDEGEWEVWPESEFEEAARQEVQDEMNDLERLSQEVAGAGAEVEEGSNTTPTEDSADSWDCPICGRPVPAEDATFNSHIDLCLSRQTIKEVVQDHASPVGEEAAPMPQILPAETKTVGRTGRGRPPKRRAAGLNAHTTRSENTKKIKAFFG